MSSSYVEEIRDKRSEYLIVAGYDKNTQQV